MQARTILEACFPRWLWNAYKHQRFYQIVKNYLKSPEKDAIIIKCLLNNNSIAIDIGANIGVYSCTMASIAQTVYAIEPIPETYEGLRYVIKKMKYTNITAINAAVSDKIGSVKMIIPVNKQGVKLFYRSHIAESTVEPLTITRTLHSITLDSEFLPMAASIGFVKCDVEGHEIYCLKGAAQLLSHGQSAWLLEINDQSDEKGSNAQTIFNLFKTYDYTPWIFDGNILQKRKKGEYSVNYFFLKDSHCQKLSSNGFL